MSRKPTGVDDAAKMIIGIIRAAGEPISGLELHKRLDSAGCSPTVWKHWNSTIRRWVQYHPQIHIDGSKYRWGSPIATEDKLSQFMTRQLAPQWLRHSWQNALASGDLSFINQALRTAQERQAKIDMARAVALVAIEVEEITHNGADSEQILKRVRSAAALRDLTRIGEAGEEISLDPALHQLRFGNPRPGIQVFVVKPGYSWRFDDEELIIERALVSTT